MIISDQPTNPTTLPVIAVREGIVFPNTENMLVFGRKKSTDAVNEALKKDKRIILVMQRNPSQDDPKSSELFDMGVIATIEKTVLGEKGEINALVKGKDKVKIKQYIKDSPYFEASYELVTDEDHDDEEIQAMVKHISAQVKKAINLGKPVDFVFLMNILNIGSALDFSYQVAMVLDLKGDERQQLLEEENLKKRLSQEVEYITREIKVLEIEQNISAKTQQKFERGMRETFLREKMKTIEEELGGKNEDKEIHDYHTKIKKAKMPKEVDEKAIKELKRLSQMSQFNPEASYIRTYLDWLVDVPWTASGENNIDIKQSEKILDEDHFGLKKVKERILEYLAVMELKKLKQDKMTKEEKKGKEKGRQPTILCFIGPPGVGKTSLGKSIARSLDRKFVKVSIGGIRDEAEIRGHRRTYVGAMPGRIIQGIKQAGSKNPVFMLDEIDKVGKDYRGDPTAALLETLDPEQNHAFSDHYLEVPYDLSDVFFITTANVLATIPDALLDRLEVIHFAGYTEDEKFNIAKEYLIKKQVEAHNLDNTEMSITDDGLRTIIRRYTREAGVRNLERQIATICRKVAREVLGEKDKDYIPGKDPRKSLIDEDHISKYLGPFRFSSSMIEEKDTVGISTGLAWTQAGGDILFIEVATMPGKGQLVLTGQLGDVMKESGRAALSYVRSRWNLFGLPQLFFQKMDIHVHVPEGAVPKDGPSAGLAITTAMISALTKIPVRRDVAMTGEVTLRGRAMEIGGVKEKVIAAHRAQIKTVILPKDNKKDLEDIPKYVLDDLEFVFVDHVDDVLKVALAYPPNKPIFPLVQKEFATLKKEEKMN